MKNLETLSTKSLAVIISDLREGHFVIPDFQREFEWGPGDVNELIRSIFEDYYIGTFLLWRATHENLNFLKCEPIYGYKGVPKPEQIVLDGQQRLSALYYAFFAPDVPFPRRKSKYLFFIDITKLLEENYDEAFRYEYGKSAETYLTDSEKQFLNKQFPLKIFGDSGHAWLKWIDQYKNYWKNKGEDIQIECQKLEDFISDLIEKYYIGYISLDREIPVEKVCDIFTRINSTGIRLDIFDLMNALLRPKDINLKEKWRDNSKLFNLPDRNKGKIFILQTMSILKQEYCAPKFLYYIVPEAKKKIREKDGSFHDIVLIQSSEEFNQLWDHALLRNLKSLKMLSNPKDFGAIAPKFIPYPSMLPIFTALNIEAEKDLYEDKKSIQDKIRAWYWASVFTSNYSSSVESTMAQDLRDMRRWFFDNQKIPLVIKKFKKVLDSPDFLLKLSAGSAIYKGIFCLLARKGALDFFSWQLPEYSQLDDHHIVPQSWGKRHKLNTIDSILNRTPISDSTNRNVINDRLPNDYIKEMINRNGIEEVLTLFESHLVSKEALDVLLRKPFTSSDFDEFIKIRNKIILNEISNLINEIPIDLTNIEADYEEADPGADTEEDFFIDPSTILICDSFNSFAKAKPGRGDKIIILKESKAALKNTESFENHPYRKLKDFLIAEKILIEENGNLIFKREYEFESPSAAAAIVLGHVANGQLEWKNEAKVALAELKKQFLIKLTS